MSINDSSLSLHCIHPSLPTRFWPDAPDENGASTTMPIYPLLPHEIMPESQHISESRYEAWHIQRSSRTAWVSCPTPEHASLYYLTPSLVVLSLSADMMAPPLHPGDHRNPMNAP
ncbi:hypothetical protein FIBSPDRAFT_874927 [Athelia psychrophila]|uniref:Uncharacterized protein n=1 Tax=Athelia psychrophila TaxID=1759441 RepID=A0A165WWZ9_9AGAM|nr:hypothetical protein FIBSPDRAFT_874927 [Fibularhizoctonia sp. CBS 109695]